MTEIRKDLTYFVPNAIVIKTADKEMFLGSFIYREKAYQVLSVLWANARADTGKQLVDLEALKRAVHLAKKSERSNSTTSGQASELDADACAHLDLGPDDELTARLFAPPADPASAPLPALLQPSTSKVCALHVDLVL